MLVDTHTHLNFRAFADDWQEVVDRAAKSGVEKMIVVGTDLESSKRALEMASDNDHLWAAAGVHPHHVKGVAIDASFGAEDLEEELSNLTKAKQVVAIGEVGLDYHKYQNSKYPDKVLKIDSKQKNLQKRLLGMQVQIAKTVRKPMIIHNREAGDEVLDVMEHFSKSDGEYPRGVFHCFDGGKKYLRKVLKAGFYVSFTGSVTYVTDRAIVATEVPLERLLLETDCPFMKPSTKETRLKNQRSEPKDVKIVAEFHARERGISVSKVVEQTTKNAERLFGF